MVAVVHSDLKSSIVPSVEFCRFFFCLSFSCVLCVIVPSVSRREDVSVHGKDLLRLSFRSCDKVCANLLLDKQSFPLRFNRGPKYGPTGMRAKSEVARGVRPTVCVDIIEIFSVVLKGY